MVLLYFSALTKISEIQLVITLVNITVLKGEPHTHIYLLGRYRK